MTTQQVKDTITNATKIDKELPEALRKPLQPPTEFPIDSLPVLLKAAVLGVHDKIQAPIAICAQSVLAAANLVVQGHADVMLPFGQRRPISCFFLTIAESGERKSSCDNEPLTAIRDHETKLSEEYNSNYISWKNDFDAWEKQRNTILRDNKNYPNRENKKAALDQLGKAPEPLLTPLLVCPEPTFEGLCKLMMGGLPSLGIFSSEGGQFIGGYGMSAENKVRTVASLSNVWDGEAIKRVRAGDGTVILNGRRLCMHLMVQPDIAAGFLSDRTLKDQGILSRILVAYPSSAIGSRFYHEVKPESITAINSFYLSLESKLSMPLSIKQDCTNELEPRLIALSQEAIKTYYEFANHIEESMAVNQPLEHIKGFANKLPEHMLRIAATLALIEDINVIQLENNYLEMAIDIAEYYGAEVLRLFDEGRVSSDLLLAEKLLTWLRYNWSEENISLPDIYQSSLNAIDTKSKALKVVEILENHGWLKKNEEQIIIKGRNRQNTWKIIKGESYE